MPLQGEIGAISFFLTSLIVRLMGLLLEADNKGSVVSAVSGLSYATPPMTSSPLAPGPSEDKENHPPVKVINLTGDSEDEEEVLDRAED